MIDASCGLSPEDEELRKALPSKPVLYVVNKIDIVNDYQESFFREKLANVPLVSISAKNGHGIDGLEQAVYDLVAGGEDWDPGHDVVPNIRHRGSS